MRTKLANHFETIVIASVVALVVGAVPVVATQYDAQNAHKVDDKHAVGAGASQSNRAGKLVATNGQGVLPNDIINKAPDAAKLGGQTLKSLLAAPGSVDLMVEITNAPDDVDPTDIFDVDYTITNLGPRRARNIRFVADGAEVMDFQDPPGVVCVNNQYFEMVCGRGSLAPDQVLAVTLNWRVDGCSPGPFTMTAVVNHTPTFDINPANDSDSATITCLSGE